MKQENISRPIFDTQMISFSKRKNDDKKLLRL